MNSNRWIALFVVLVLLGVAVTAGARYDLGSSNNFQVRWNGGTASDKIGNSFSRTAGIFIVNVDGESSANDVLITAYLTDANGKSNAGAVYLIKDFNFLSGTKDLNAESNFDVAWIGSMANDQLSFTNVGENPGIQIGNVDNGAYANDLLITAINADANGKSDSGAVYLIKNIDGLSGFKDLNVTTNFDAAWTGGIASDQLGYTNHSGPGVQLVNIDNGASANDLILGSVNADVNGKSNNGVIYLIKDINSLSGTYDMNSESNFTVRWIGGTASDNLGYVADSWDGAQLINADNGAYSNDLLVSARNADMNSKVDAGAVYLLKNVNTLSGSKDLSVTANFDAAWNGGKGGAGTADRLGYTNDSGSGTKLVNIDNGAYANDLILMAIDADLNAKTDNGGVYLIKNIDALSGAKDLNVTTNFDAAWIGASASDALGYTADANSGVQLVNIDNGAYANDFFITAANADVNSKTNSGAVYLIKNVDSLSGYKDLSTATNFDVRWNGDTASDLLGSSDDRELGVQLINADNGPYSNDVVLTAVLADVNGKADAGAIYLIKNTDSLSGIKDLNVPSNFDVRWNGGVASDKLGNTLISGPGVQILNIDNGPSANDLLITAVNADVNGISGSGAVYLIKDINLLSGAIDLNSESNFNVRWAGTSSSETIGNTTNRALDLKVVNVDGGPYSNDLFIPSPTASIGGKSSNGALYLIRNIDSLSGAKNLAVSSDFDVRWSGGAASDKLIFTNVSGPGWMLVNSDNGAYANDLIVTAVNADINSKTDAGAIYLLTNIVPAPDANITRIDASPDTTALPYFSYSIDGNLTIDFNATDADSNNLRVDLNYSPSATPYTGTAIVTRLDLNSLPASGAYNCADTNFEDSTQCSIDWNISNIADGNYFIHITVTDGISTDQNTSDNNFGIDNSGPSVSITNTTPATSTSTHFTLQYSGSDSQSGIQTYWLRDGTGDWINNGTVTSYTFSISAGAPLPSYHTYSVIATNSSDVNSGTASITVTYQSASGGGGGQPLGPGKTPMTPGRIPPIDRPAPPPPEPPIISVYQTSAIDATTQPYPVIQADPTQTTPILRRLASATEIEALRTLRIFAQIENGTTRYLHEFELFLTNTSGHILRGIELIETTPKEFAQNAAQLESKQTFEILEEDPVIRFSIQNLSRDETAIIKYRLSEPKSKPISEAAFLEMKPAVVSVNATSGVSCEGVWCDDENPCTIDECTNGTCTIRPAQNGTACKDNHTCQNGQCTASPGTTRNETLPGFPTANPILFLIALFFISFFAWKKRNIASAKP